MQAARAAYRAKKPLTPKQLASGVLTDINDLALWEVYGGRSECLNAPRSDVHRKRLVLWGRTLAQQDQAKELEDKSKEGGSSSSSLSNSGNANAQARVSRSARPTPRAGRARRGPPNPYEPLDEDDGDGWPE